MDEETRQKTIGKMQVIAELLEIETGAITLRIRPSVSDFDTTRRWAWDMIDRDVRFGGVVICSTYDEDCGYPTELVRSFAHCMTRQELAYGEYEALAERAYCETPPPATPDEIAWVAGSSGRKSEKTLLNDLILLRAKDVISHSDLDDVPTAEEVLRRTLSPERSVSLAHDIDAFREKDMRERTRRD